jgi:phosphate transport system substrate-binding protein
MKPFILVAAAALLLTAAPTAAQDVIADAGVKGAGSTFVYPLIGRWSQGYRDFVSGGSAIAAAGTGLDTPPPGGQLDYEPSGSLAGTMRVVQGAVDFGASEVPLDSATLGKLKLAQFPLVVGGVVAVVNLDGVRPGQIRFNGPVLADIFLGKIENWSDPAILALNPALKLPDTKIAVIRRSDGSGTTFNFTSYLSAQSAAFKDKVGTDLLVKWPVGAGAKGNDGISQAVKQTPNSIGYIEYSQAVRAGLAFAAMQNRAGTFVAPEPKSFAAAAANADWAAAGDFSVMLNDAPGPDAYPMVATVFVMMKKDGSARRNRAALAFFDWALASGADSATSLGYVPLPAPLVAQIKGYWVKNTLLPAGL